MTSARSLLTFKQKQQTKCAKRRKRFACPTEQKRRLCAGSAGQTVVAGEGVAFQCLLGNGRPESELSCRRDAWRPIGGSNRIWTISTAAVKPAGLLSLTPGPACFACPLGPPRLRLLLGSDFVSNRFSLAESGLTLPRCCSCME